MTRQQFSAVKILGIETSCDETAAAVVERSADGKATVLANVVLSQLAYHAPYGGVVPEIAARAHVNCLDVLTARALDEANCTLDDIDAIAATAGPGLMGGLMVGLMTAKAIALAKSKPLIAVNHLEAHILTPGMTEDLKPPYLVLLVSGGHTQILAVRDIADYQRYGTTIDDALGEAFDKTAKLLGLGYPGGPAVEACAKDGDANRFTLPRPLKGTEGCNFSFSGLKTAVRQAAENIGTASQRDVADICASFQSAVCSTLTDRLDNAMARFTAQFPELRKPTLVVAGGVAANRMIRRALDDMCISRDWSLIAPPIELCGDNAAMIAWAGGERFVRGLTDDLDVSARARWPLDPDAVPAPFAGVKA